MGKCESGQMCYFLLAKGEDVGVGSEGALGGSGRLMGAPVAMSGSNSASSLSLGFNNSSDGG